MLIALNESFNFISLYFSISSKCCNLFWNFKEKLFLFINENGLSNTFSFSFIKLYFNFLFVFIIFSGNLLNLIGKIGWLSIFILYFIKFTKFDLLNGFVKGFNFTFILLLFFLFDIFNVLEKEWLKFVVLFVESFFFLSEFFNGELIVWLCLFNNIFLFITFLVFINGIFILFFESPIEFENSKFWVFLINLLNFIKSINFFFLQKKIINKFLS